MEKELVGRGLTLEGPSPIYLLIGNLGADDDDDDNDTGWTSVKGHQRSLP